MSDVHGGVVGGEGEPEGKKLSVQPEEAVAARNGVTKEDSKATKPFTWLQPHPIFVILFVGPDERPFGIQKDFLCHRSNFYRKYFETGEGDALEHIVRLPEASEEVFGMVQNFLYTGEVVMEPPDVPSYESLVGLWNLGHKLEIEGLCDQTLEAMVECRRVTRRIPATPLLIQVWRDTPEGSTIRILLLSWAAEYMRFSRARAEFARSLPQEVLSELVVTMSSFDTLDSQHPVVAAAAATLKDSSMSLASQVPPDFSPTEVKPLTNAALAAALRKNVHYLEGPADEEALGASLPKRNRRSAGAVQEQLPTRRPYRKAGASPPPPPPTPPPKVQKRRSSAAYLEGRTFTSQQKLDFCADLLTRMLSGPGFWTRLVGPFKQPVDPVEDGVPDYLEKVKRPMDLGSIKAKMDRKEYVSDEEFLVDVRQIFDNCFTYWNKGDPLWIAGERLQKTFEDKFSNMHKWIAKMGGEEGD